MHELNASVSAHSDHESWLLTRQCSALNGLKHSDGSNDKMKTNAMHGLDGGRVCASAQCTFVHVEVEVENSQFHLYSHSPHLFMRSPSVRLLLLFCGDLSSLLPAQWQFRAFHFYVQSRALWMRSQRMLSRFMSPHRQTALCPPFGQWRLRFLRKFALELQQRTLECINMFVGS